MLLTRRSCNRSFGVCVLIACIFSSSIFPLPAVVGLTDAQRVRQVISRLTFGARPGDTDLISRIGIEAFVQQQLTPEAIDDSALEKRLQRLPTLGLSTVALAEQYNPPRPAATPTPSPTPATASSPVEIRTNDTTMGASVAQSPTSSPTPKPSPTPTPKNPAIVVNELQRAKLLRAVYSERQLYEVMVDFWENHFSIFAQKDADRWMMTAFDRDAVRPFAFGRFRDLLGAVAHSPAMLFYLDNWQSSLRRDFPATKDRPARSTGGINENYARELLELHTLGVDGGYTQKDVQEVARCLTGWTIQKPQQEGLAYYNPVMHDSGEKVVLGVKIPAGGGISDGEKVLDILAKHPSTAKFISTKLARRFIGDNPPPIVVDRAAKAFLATDGSITATLKSIITSKEFYSPTASQIKVRSPFEYVVATLRASNAETDAGALLDWLRRMGQPIYGRVTPDGWPDVASEWLSDNDLLTRLNFATALMMNQVRGTKVDIAKVVSLATEPGAMPKVVIDELLSGNVSSSTEEQLRKIASIEPPVAQTPNAAQFVPAAAKPEDRSRAVASQLVALAFGSPEFQRR
jgi:uncharacterized protein (DUF1800 family)